MTPRAGQVWSDPRHKRFRRVEQVRTHGALGLSYALTRPCGPKGRPKAHPILGDKPIQVTLMPDGSMPPGYVLAYDPDNEPRPLRGETEAAAATV